MFRWPGSIFLNHSIAVSLYLHPTYEVMHIILHPWWSGDFFMIVIRLTRTYLQHTTSSGGNNIFNAILRSLLQHVSVLVDECNPEKQFVTGPYFRQYARGLAKPRQTSHFEYLFVTPSDLIDRVVPPHPFIDPIRER